MHVPTRKENGIIKGSQDLKEKWQICKRKYKRKKFWKLCLRKLVFQLLNLENCKQRKEIGRNQFPLELKGPPVRHPFHPSQHPGAVGTGPGGTTPAVLPKPVAAHSTEVLLTQAKQIYQLFLRFDTAGRNC